MTRKTNFNSLAEQAEYDEGWRDAASGREYAENYQGIHYPPSRHYTAGWNDAKA